MSAVCSDAVAEVVVPWTGGPTDLDAVVDLVGDRRIVVLGEASHGSAEFYRERSRITQRLIEELGFDAVAAEADWPDAYRVNRYVRGTSSDPDARTALEDFRRFPSWMWRNTEVVDFIDWLHAHNARRSPLARASCRVLRTRPVQPACVDGRGRHLPGPGRTGRGSPGTAALRLLRPRTW